MLAKYGLGQVDLNQLVQLSLAGLIDKPEYYLSELLKSGQPIEPRTRTVLADVLDGRSRGARVKVVPTKKNEFVRNFRRQRRKLEFGRRVQAAMERMTYADAIKHVAKDTPYGEKTLEVCVTLAKSFQNWVQECRVARLQHSEDVLEVAFVYSGLKGTKHEDALKPSLEDFAEIVRSFEQLVADSQGHLAWRCLPQRKLP